eukprot:jgi/Undpi1/3394/HiC_scaffold_15.g06767.m1
MGTRAPAYENNGTGRSNSKKHIRKHSSSSQLGNVGSLLRVCRTSSRGLLGALILATLVGCATIALQLAVSGHGGVRHARLNARAEGDAGDGVVPPPLIYDQSAAPRGGDYLGNMDSSSSSSSSSSKDTPNRSREGKEGTTTRTTGGYPTREAIGPPEPLNPMKNQHRFGGQRTGASAKAEQGPGEAVYHLPGYSGPFGWGTDWSLSVSVEEGGEDVIEPARCKTDPAERSFVDYVMERRGEASPQVGGTTTRNTKNKVASCVLTKDNGRYLPEWVAYHWALGVDEFDILDDDSVDDTREVSEPFVRAGIVTFRQRKIRTSPEDRVEALNECVARYRHMRDSGNPSAPRWVVLINTDEYFWAGDLVSTLSDVLMMYSSTCCLQVPSVQHGSSGFSKAPRGLVIDNFLKHADPWSNDLNTPPQVDSDRPRNELPACVYPVGGIQVVVNLKPAKKSLGNFQRLSSLYHTEDCPCELAPVAEIGTRRYALTLEDLTAKAKAREPALGKVSLYDGTVFNNFATKDMQAWGCVVRHLLSRAASGKHVVTGKSLPTLSPHHPVAHGMRAMDPYGEEEASRTAMCLSTIHSSPAMPGLQWGKEKRAMLPTWLQELCSTRYVFIHSFEGTGELEVAEALNSHAWVRSHTGASAAMNGGAVLTSSIPTVAEMRRKRKKDVLELCGCTEDTRYGCRRYCPRLKSTLLDSDGVNKIRRQLFQDWSRRFKFQPNGPGEALVLVERDADMFLATKQALFPSVSTSILTVRHPMCTPAVARLTSDTDVTAGLREWYQVWKQVLVKQVPEVAGDVWVVSPEFPSNPRGGMGQGQGWGGAGVEEGMEVRAEMGVGVGVGVEMEAEVEEIQKEARRLGRPERGRRRRRRRLIAGDPFSRSPASVRNVAIPEECRTRMDKCEDDPACAAELQRSAVLMDFFGYGGKGELLQAQRFLWGKEELVWLGRRLKAGPASPNLTKPENFEIDSGDEPSFILPQAYDARGILMARGGGGGGGGNDDLASGDKPSEIQPQAY